MRFGEWIYMKSDNNNNCSNFGIVISLLIVLVLAVLLVFFYMEKNRLEEKINENLLLFNDLSERLDDTSAKLRHKQMQINFLYESTDIAEQLSASMKPLAVELPASSVYAADSTLENAELAEHNKIYLGKIQQNEPSYVVDYISTENDKTTYYIVMSKIKQLSDGICLDCKTELEKADSIAQWVVRNICYNDDAASTKVDADVISLEQVLSTKTATCAGYSDLFAALCQAQGICAINLRGGTEEALYRDPDWKTVRTNHEWNAVFCDGGWHFFDTTWCSQNIYSNGEYYYSDKQKTEYLDMDFDAMTKDRRIDRVDLRDFYGALFTLS